MPLNAEEQAMVESNLDVADRVASRGFYYRHGAILGIEDMKGLAREFLCLAARSWKPDSGVPFRAYATNLIKRRMIDWLRVNGSQNRQGQLRLSDQTVPFILDNNTNSRNDPDEIPSENHIPEWKLPQFEYDLVSSMWMEEALARLPKKEELILRACILEDIPNREVADALGVSESRVAQHLRRALDRLRSDREFIRATIR